ESPRPEVGIASAWGLKKFALAETLPAILDKARRQTELRQKLEAVPEYIDRQTAHLFEAIGRMRYAPADSLLRQYMPKEIPKVYKMGELSRCSAIWSLGLLHAGAADESLAEQLMDRINDDGPYAESAAVKEMCAVSIARMKALSQVAALRKRITPM